MKTTRIYTTLLLSCVASLALLPPLHAAETAPILSSSVAQSTNISITVSNLAAGSTYYLEQTSNLLSNDWNKVYHFEGFPGETNWISPTGTPGFFRALQDPYHPKVGEVAAFTADHHGVAGTAHIVNNRTLELRNFSYDATGLDVRVFVSPNASFYPGFSLSTNLVRSLPYTNETLSFSIPEGTDLNDFGYISIWCIDIPVSFGDGAFQ